MKKKTYRESLQNNRDNILLSKELVTIHTTVPIEYTLEAMRTQPVDNAACRELFAELEFTTLLKELAPAVDNTPMAFELKPLEAQVEGLLAQARVQGTAGLAVAIFEDSRALAEEVAVEAARRLSLLLRRRCLCSARLRSWRELSLRNR